ncbi:MAG: response regulator, partial [Mariniphaga sp.]|nr:response regulator [Mariniphaga sp.]
LIVEDNPDAIIQVKTVLEREHYIVDVASGGQEAIDYVQNTIPNGIILDLMMPDIDGFEVLEKLRSTENTKLIPVIILTAKNLSQKELSKLRSNNIHQLIYKGEVDIEGLLLKVKLMLGNKPGVKEKVNIPDQILAIQKEGTINVKERQGKWENTLANVLIVEDNPDNMITIKAIINGKYNIIEAINGEEGLMLAQSQRPDLILLDMSLPKLGGRQIIRILRADEKTQNIPIIAVTAQAMSGDKEKIINTGADGYVAKPIDHENLLTEISRFLKE